jgi:hypothetical protein
MTPDLYFPPAIAPGSCSRARRLSFLTMHRDLPPGPFDFAARSVRYMVGFWFTAGLVLSLLFHTGILLWRADSNEPHAKPSQDALEAAAAAQRAKAGKSPPPDPPAAVRY